MCFLIFFSEEIVFFLSILFIVGLIGIMWYLVFCIVFEIIYDVCFGLFDNLIIVIVLFFFNILLIFVWVGFLIVIINFFYFFSIVDKESFF